MDRSAARAFSSAIARRDERRRRATRRPSRNRGIGIRRCSRTPQSLLLATNTGGSLRREPARTFFAFASERYILTRLLHARRADALLAGCTVRQLRAGDGLLISLKDLAHHEFTAVGPGRDVHAANGFVPGRTRVEIVDHTPRAKDMRRCTRSSMKKKTARTPTRICFTASRKKSSG